MARRKAFSAAGAELREVMLLTRPRWRRTIATQLLTGPHPVSDKLMALALDEGARGAVCKYDRETVGHKARLTDKTIRKATERLGKAAYLRRVQTGPQQWEYHLLNRQPAAWMPGWTLDWWRSRLAEEIPPEALVLWGLAIQHTPSATLLSQSPHLGPWCELSTPELAKQLKISANTVPALVRIAAEAGLILALVRDRRPPIIYPTATPANRSDRCELTTCLMALVADRDGPALHSALYGRTAPTVWDDENLALKIEQRMGAVVLPPAPHEGQAPREVLA